MNFGGSGDAGRARRPANLLVVMLDEWRQSAVGSLGSDPVRTPVIDRLAAEGCGFTHAVSNYPVCSPHRAMFMSGRFPHANGVSANCNSVTGPAQQLRADLRCWSDVLADAGYRCGYVGKWHLDAPTERDVRRARERGEAGTVWDAFTPPERRHGFATWNAYGSFNDHFRTHYWETDTAADDPRVYDGWSPVHDTDAAIEFIRGGETAPEPWALMVSYNPPHMPFHQVPQRYRDLYSGIAAEDLLNRPNVPPDHAASREAVADYFAAVTGVDEQIGRLVDSLGDQLDDTLVVVTSDHGDMMGSHGLMSKNVWYDESLMVPLIMRLPGVVPRGRNDLLTSTADLYPTILGLLGVTGAPGVDLPADLHGRDLSGAVRSLRGGPRPEVALYISRQAPWTVDVEGRWVNDRDERGIRTHRWMYVQRRSPIGDRLLFDLADDPYELRDVYASTAREHPGRVADLDAALAAELARVGDPWMETVAARGHK